MYRSFCTLTIPFSVKVYASTSLVFYQVSKLGLMICVVKYLILLYRNTTSMVDVIVFLKPYSYVPEKLYNLHQYPKFLSWHCPLLVCYVAFKQLASQHVHCAASLVRVPPLLKPLSKCRSNGNTAATLIAHKFIYVQSVAAMGRVCSRNFVACTDHSVGANCPNAVCLPCLAVVLLFHHCDILSPSLHCSHWLYSKC